jgi:hypothetical protein
LLHASILASQFISRSPLALKTQKAPAPKAQRIILSGNFRKLVLANVWLSRALASASFRVPYQRPVDPPTAGVNEETDFLYSKRIIRYFFAVCKSALASLSHGYSDSTPGWRPRIWLQLRGTLNALKRTEVSRFDRDTTICS